MLDLRVKNWSDFISSLIDSADIYYGDNDDLGIEDQPHITVLYGFIDDETNLRELRRYLTPLDYIKVSLENITIFETDDYDVVKFDVACDQLYSMNLKISKRFPHENDYDFYEPHMTIAYVKKGTGQKYVKNIKTKVAKPYRYRYTGPIVGTVFFK